MSRLKVETQSQSSIRGVITALHTIATSSINETNEPIYATATVIQKHLGYEVEDCR